MNAIMPLYFDKFLNPWAFLLVFAVIAVFLAEIFARTPGVLEISTGETAAHLSGGGTKWMRRLPAILRAIGLVLLIVALARPITGFRVHKERANVIDIMLCVDVSGSMLSQDFIYGGKRADRLTATKMAVLDFLQSRKEHKGDRFGLDRIGLVLYSTFAWTQCPLTLDYGVLEHELDRAHVSEDPQRQSTAIGSAIGLAVSRLRKSEAKSKVVILLTDGLNNAGQLSPLTAASLAKDCGVRIYTIGAGSTEGGVVPGASIFGMVMTRQSEGIDEEVLKKIASATGGRYYRATDTTSLDEAYKEINALETTEVELGDTYEHEENFVPFVIAGAIALLLSVFVRRYWFEVIP